MGRLNVVSRIALLIALVLMALYYVFRKEIMSSVTYYVRLGVHLMVLVFSVAVMVAPFAEFKAYELYGTLIGGPSAVAKIKDPASTLLRMPRLGMLIFSGILLLMGTAWASLTKEESVTVVPGMLCGVGAVACLTLNLTL
jgi:hypothetical protein